MTFYRKILSTLALAACLAIISCRGQQNVRVAEVADYRNGPHIPAQYIIVTSAQPPSVLDQLVDSMTVVLKSLFMGWFIYEVLRQVFAMIMILGFVFLMAVGLSSKTHNIPNPAGPTPITIV